MARYQSEEKKPLLFRDGVLLVIAAAGCGACLYFADARTGEFSTALRVWGYLLGFIAATILLSIVTDKSKKRKKP